MVNSDYVPARGDIVWLSFTPQAGHEQAGHRPALVLSPEAYNEKTSLALCCPITSRVKGYPFEVDLPSTSLSYGSGASRPNQKPGLEGQVRPVRVSRHTTGCERSLAQSPCPTGLTGPPDLSGLAMSGI